MISALLLLLLPPPTYEHTIGASGTTLLPLTGVVKLVVGSFLVVVVVDWWAFDLSTVNWMASACRGRRGRCQWAVIVRVVVVVVVVVRMTMIRRFPDDDDDDNNNNYYYHCGVGGDHAAEPPSPYDSPTLGLVRR